MRNKVGDQKYYIIISMILGLIVLTLSLYFIFQEYFTEDELDWQQCRQSVILRANLPELKKGAYTLVSLKDDFPLKCKTEVVEVSKKDYEDDEAGKIVGDVLAECWYTFLEGEAQIFPADLAGFESYCVPCARVHFEEDIASEGININLLESLRGNFNDGKYSYLDYLKKGFMVDVWYQTPLLNWKKVEEVFEIKGSTFFVDDSETGGLLDFLASHLYEKGEIAAVTLPNDIDTSKGDLIVVVGQSIGSNGGFNSYLLYFQVGQEEPFEELKKDFMEAGDNSAPLCKNWDGVPA
jgi:hypothetical protein